MATHQTSPGRLGRSVEGERGGRLRLALRLDAVATAAVGVLMLLAAGWLPLTVLGVAFVLAQATAVALFAALQFLGLRRSRSATK